MLSNDLITVAMWLKKKVGNSPLFYILDEAEEFDREFTSRARRNLMGNGSDGHRSRAIEGGTRYGDMTSSSRSHVSDS